LSQMEHTNNHYSHQGWLTDDYQYVYLNDELDEQNTGTPTTTRIIDVSNLSTPGQAGTCSTGLTSIDHNLYIVGDRMYQANYRSGLQVFDISNPTSPTRSSWFDTYPSDDGASFNGMWSNYPFLPSGVTICSDLERGLFVLSAASIEISLVNDLPEMLSPAGDSLEVRIRGLGGGEPDTDSFELHLNDGSGDQVLSLNPTGNAEIWTVDFPAMECGNFANWYLSATSLSGQTVTLPSSGNTNPYETLVADGLIESFNDDFETDTGWAVENECTDGQWSRGVPVNGGRGDPQSDADNSGSCFVTDNVIGNSDVDGGFTRLTSPTLDASASGALLSYWRWYSNDFGAAPNEDIFTVEVSDDNGSNWVTLEIVGPSGLECSGGWYQKQFAIGSMAGISPSDTFRVRFTADDSGSGSVVEAGVDGVSITAVDCDDLETCPADCANGDGVVDVQDVLEVLAQFGESGGCDIDGNGVVDVSDMLEVIAFWGNCP
ncbi:MAG: choice-of-anchor B family protein, partial [Planctomycetota bacterium]|nr:choice-of-anchor B family protein [Planctomycetota bacterium]